jgi:phage shock protein PspC (stress-responsive transcriptional regulator)
MQDIELRITELLSDRHVQQGDVITAQDVHVIEKQLGEPAQFADDKTSEKSSMHTKRLLRDTDNAILGGVASGLGAYFGIDGNLFRAAFLILTFTGGLGILIYLFLWLFVPAARTNADKLQMLGKPVTVATLQRYRASAQRTLGRSKLLQRPLLNVFRTILTVCIVLVTLAIALSIAVGTGLLYMQPLRSLVWAYHTNYFVIGLIWFGSISIVALLATLVRQLWHRGHSFGIRIALIASFTGFLFSLIALTALTPVVTNHYESTYGNGKLTTSLAVQSPKNIRTLTTLNDTTNNDVVLNYVTVTNQPLHATYEKYPGMSNRPDISVTANKNTITVSAQNLNQAVPSCLWNNVCKNIYLPIHVTLYGPAVQNITANMNTDLTVSNLSNSVSVTATNGASISLINSNLNLLTINAAGASIDASSITAQSAVVTMNTNSNVSTPNTSSLTANYPTESCQENDNPILFVPQYPSKNVINGQFETQQTFDQNNCIHDDSTNNVNIYN